MPTVSFYRSIGFSVSTQLRLLLTFLISLIPYSQILLVYVRMKVQGLLCALTLHWCPTSSQDGDILNL